MARRNMLHVGLFFCLAVACFEWLRRRVVRFALGVVMCVAMFLVWAVCFVFWPSFVASVAFAAAIVLFRL